MNYQCEDCGWPWPLATEPRYSDECDNCGGYLVNGDGLGLPGYDYHELGET